MIQDRIPELEHPLFDKIYRNVILREKTFFERMEFNSKRKFFINNSKTFNINNKDLFIEFATGVTDIFYYWAKKEKKTKFICLDLDPVNIEYQNQRKKLKNLQYLVQNVEEPILEYKNQADFIMMYDSLHHVDIKKCLKNAYTTLKKGGTLLLRDIKRITPEEMISTYSETIIHLVYDLKRQMPANDFIKKYNIEINKNTFIVSLMSRLAAYKKEEIEHNLELSGFKILKENNESRNKYINVFRAQK
jgi:ubiquinone/menaquinone biosynthesis C-methylase UbiE